MVCKNDEDGKKVIVEVDNEVKKVKIVKDVRDLVKTKNQDGIQTKQEVFEKIEVGSKRTCIDFC